MQTQLMVVCLVPLKNLKELYLVVLRNQMQLHQLKLAYLAKLIKMRTKSKI